jgi:ATP-dependent RNA helicase DeaD
MSGRQQMLFPPFHRRKRIALAAETALILRLAALCCLFRATSICVTTTLFSELGLSGELLKAIDKLGFEQAAPIQAAAIPVLLQGKDAVGQSQTGSGKTVAFAAPAIEKVVVEERNTQVLILCPTRELAVQVSEEVHKLAFFKRGLHALPIYGGQSYDRQLYGLRQGAHIVIGTPGRVMDHMRRGTLRLNSVKLAVLDEVDVMLNMGFRDDIELILQGTPNERQTVFFSATIPRPIQQLIEKYSRDPQHIRIEQQAMTVPTVEQVFYEVDRRFKVDLLTRLIDLHDFKLGLIFCNTRRMVDDLVEHLNAQGYSADRLHGDMTQTMRDRVMNRFRKSGLEFLVATDVAARGIDVENIEVVFNYDLPYDGEDYVHRIGRTGRQGRSGRAISFASGREVFQIRAIERYVNTRIHRATAPTVDEVEAARANVVLDRVRATLKSGAYRRQDKLIECLLEEGFSSTDIASALLHHLQGGEGAPATQSAREDTERRREPQVAETSRHGVHTAPRGPEQREAGRPRDERPATVSQDARRRPHENRPPGHRDEPFQRRDRAAEPRHHAVAGAATVNKSPGAAKPPHQEARPPASPVPRHAEPAAVRPPKPSRRTPEGETRLYVNTGAEMGVSEGDVVGAILGETGLPRKVVGTVDIRERHLFVDVASEHANSIISKLNRTQIKGRGVKVKVA